MTRNTRLETTFPKLRATGYRITSQEDRRYNCIAWAIGKNNEYWWPGPHTTWPEDKCECSLEAFVSILQTFGYVTCEYCDLEPGFEKVAIYVKDNEPTHMARQLPSGKWTSKCGDRHDIEHDRLEGLEDSIYGKVVSVMKRKRKSSVKNLQSLNS